MARVVQRSTPPYLTILFVFLFFITAALAAWFGNGWRSTDKMLTAKTDTIKSIASRSEQSDERMAAQRARAGRGRTVIGQYRADQDALLTAIRGDQDMPIEQVLEATSQMPLAGQGMFGLMDTMRAKAKTDAESLQRMQGEVESLTARLTTEQEAAAAAQAAAEADRAKLSAELNALQAKVDSLSEGYDGSIKQATTDWNARFNEQKQLLADKDEEIRKIEKSLRDKDIRVTQLMAQLGSMDPDVKADVVADGKIVKIVDDNVVYINIGTNERVRIGLPFSVYSKRTGTGSELPIKAKILVANVFDEIAECRVLEADTTDPIVVDDPIANIAFSSMASPTFVVEGDFDIDADGEADRQSNAKVRAMIERFGGTVIDEIDVNVDYVVMGEVPVRQPRPDADAPPSDLALWEANEAKAQRYHTIKAEAIKLSKPVLNTIRFLNFIGYAPETIAQ